MMDIDDQELSQSQPQPRSISSSLSRLSPIVLVDSSHPFDLDSYISSYTGRTAIDRLIHIVSLCPSVAPDAFALAVQLIQKGRDPSLWQALCHAYEQVSSYANSSYITTGSTLNSDGDGNVDGDTSSSLNLKLPSLSELPAVPSRWVDETMKRNHADKIKLEAELKGYSNNMIKESIRMGHRDLAEFCRSIGDYPSALKHWTKSREFCTTSQHVLDGCLSTIELLIEQRNYSHLPTYVFKAEAALEAVTSSASANNAKSDSQSASAASSGPSTTGAGAGSGSGTGAGAGAGAGTSGLGRRGAGVGAGVGAGGGGGGDREIMQSKLDFATALAQLGQANYERAAYHFLRLSSSSSGTGMGMGMGTSGGYGAGTGAGGGGLGDWFGKLVSPGDIAIYGSVCALASLSRSGFKAQVLENLPFGVYVEQEPHVREMIEAYMASRFKGVLETLGKYNTRHTIDIHLYPHLSTLLSLTRNRLVSLYFAPFSSIKLDRMASAFGWTLGETEEYVVGLVQSGDIKGRVDSRDRVLMVNKRDPRGELFRDAVRKGVQMVKMNEKLLYRIKLQQADLVIRPPKNAQNNAAMPMSDYLLEA